MSIRLELTAETAEELEEMIHQMNRLVSAPRLSTAGRKATGKRLRKRTDEEVLHILKRANEIGVYAAAAEAGVSPAWLSRIRNGHIWRHLGVA